NQLFVFLDQCRPALFIAVQAIPDETYISPGQSRIAACRLTDFDSIGGVGESSGHRAVPRSTERRDRGLRAGSFRYDFGQPQEYWGPQGISRGVRLLRFPGRGRTTACALNSRAS